MAEDVYEANSGHTSCGAKLLGTGWPDTPTLPALREIIASTEHVSIKHILVMAKY